MFERRRAPFFAVQSSQKRLPFRHEPRFLPFIKPFTRHEVIA
jgi:hypothetical protein